MTDASSKIVVCRLKVGDLALIKILVHCALLAVSAISVGPRPTASPTGRQVCQVVGPPIRQLDWGMKLVKSD